MWKIIKCMRDVMWQGSVIIIIRSSLLGINKGSANQRLSWKRPLPTVSYIINLLLIKHVRSRWLRNISFVLFLRVHGKITRTEEWTISEASHGMDFEFKASPDVVWKKIACFEYAFSWIWEKARLIFSVKRPFTAILMLTLVTMLPLTIIQVRCQSASCCFTVPAI